MRITKSDLSRAIAGEAGISQKKSTQAASKIIDLMMNTLASGEDVRISGFGKFHRKTLSARSGRHPRSGQKIAIASRHSVGFKCFKGLRSRINGTPDAQVPSDAPPEAQIERRREVRQENLPMGRACIRFSGIPVCEFPIKDLSGNGSCILVEAQSMIMRNIRIGQVIEIHIPGPDFSDKSVLQRSKITHITRQSEQDQFPGYVMVGVHILDRFASH